jgi:hypothetical protein
VFSLKDKCILLLSPQAWGVMLLSKHHYALALAKRGNLVYFLNPPEEQFRGLQSEITIRESGIHPNLKIVTHRTPIPYQIKFHFISLYHFFMKRHIHKMCKMLDKRPDIIWSFDLGNLYPFSAFGSESYKIYHPVDAALNQAAIASANGADIIFSVTKEILQNYQHLNLPRFCINHGLADDFATDRGASSKPLSTIKIGLSGNFRRPDIDWPILLRIIAENPTIHFEFWGSYRLSQSNIGGASTADIEDYIERLVSLPNVFMHGPVSTEDLARQLCDVDAFLICYDIQKDQSGGTNYHKVLEYLSTGKVIIANNITAYEGLGDLVKMVPSRTSNDSLPKLFSETVQALSIHNSPADQLARRKFAMKYLYSSQITQIEELISTVIN